MPEDDQTADLGWPRAAVDFDGDGAIDVLAGAPFEGEDRGVVYVIWG